MYAIVDIAGQQFKVEEGKKIFVHRLEGENGASVEFDKVLLIGDDEKTIIGEPVIKDAIVEGKILEHMKGDKVIVFKKKRKKGYRVKNGHRQYLTHVEIISIGDRNAPRKSSQEKEAAVSVAVETGKQAEEPKEAAEKKAPAKKGADNKPAKENAPVKKTPAKKTAVEKATVKKTPAKKSAKDKE
jgi:large subunit ribosomal protein L21